jgi:hypothetical protein
MLRTVPVRVFMIAVLVVVATPFMHVRVLMAIVVVRVTMTFVVVRMAMVMPHLRGSLQAGSTAESRASACHS